MTHHKAQRYGLRLAAVATCMWLAVLLPPTCGGMDSFDLISGVIESPQFKGKDPISRLKLASELLRVNRLKQSDMAFILLDWGDEYLREPADPLERLKRWSKLANDKKLGHLKIPRDFLNRILLADYLVNKTSYLKVPPLERLQILRKLEEKGLLDWSVGLAYARLYAGTIISGSKGFTSKTPLQALTALKRLEKERLIGRHYRVPTEAIIVAEALALDQRYQKATPLDRLLELRDLEQKGLITTINKREMEKLPAWRLLVHDPSFLKADPNEKRVRISRLKEDGLISPATYSDLIGIFRPIPLSPAMEAAPAPVPRKIPPPSK